MRTSPASGALACGANGVPARAGSESGCLGAACLGPLVRPSNSIQRRDPRKSACSASLCAAIPYLLSAWCVGLLAEFELCVARCNTDGDVLTLAKPPEWRQARRARARLSDTPVDSLSVPPVDSACRSRLFIAPVHCACSFRRLIPLVGFACRFRLPIRPLHCACLFRRLIPIVGFACRFRLFIPTIDSAR